MKRFLTLCSLCCFGIFVAFVLSELILRICISDPPYIARLEYSGCIGDRAVTPNTQATYENPETGVRVIQYNEFGFRGALEDHQKVVFFLGDSIVEADEVAEEERFTNILERNLRKNGEDAAVWNLGLPGAGTNSELCAFERALQKRRPNLVVLTFFENDLGDNIFWDHMSASAAHMNYNQENCFNTCSLGALDSLGRFHRKLKEFSYVYRYSLGKLSPLIHGWKDFDLHFKRSSPFYSTPSSEINRRSRDETKKLLEQFVRRTDELGVKLLIVAIPTLTYMNPETWNTYAKNFNSDGSIEWDTRQNYNWLMDQCNFQKWSCTLVDALDSTDYFPNDQHLTRSGHAKVAEQLRLAVQNAL